MRNNGRNVFRPLLLTILNVLYDETNLRPRLLASSFLYSSLDPMLSYHFLRFFHDRHDISVDLTIVCSTSMAMVGRRVDGARSRSDGTARMERLLLISLFCYWVDKRYLTSLGRPIRTSSSGHLLSPYNNMQKFCLCHLCCDVHRVPDRQ